MGWLGLAMGLLICRSQLLPGTINVAKTPDLRKLHPRARISYNLLIEHDIKLPSKYISLCLYICVALSSHQWTTPRQPVKEERIKKCLDIFFTLAAQDTSWKRADIPRARCWEDLLWRGIFWKYHSQALVNSPQLPLPIKDLHRSGSMNILSWKGKGLMKHHFSSQKAIDSQWWLWGC